MFSNIKKPQILIVDDTDTNRKLLASIIIHNTNYTVNLLDSGTKVLESLDSLTCDLILLDVMMPEINGYEVAKKIKSNENFKNVPILFITALTEPDEIIHGFQAGGVDYISKPFNKEELLARIKTHLDLKIIRDDLEKKNALLADRELHLANLVDKKSKQVNEITMSLVVALENANLFNDTDTGNHIKRVCEYSYFLATKMNQSPLFCNRIKLYASLHDVGKIGIPDIILKKNGKYKPEEFELMKEHVTIGAKILDSASVDPMAKNIALYHHEKWDGNGYANKLSAEDIPLEARIVSVADAYDALGSKRVYKPAFDETVIDKIILDCRGTQFDPKIVDVLMKYKDELLDIKYRLSEGSI